MIKKKALASKDVRVFLLTRNFIVADLEFLRNMMLNVHGKSVALSVKVSGITEVYFVNIVVLILVEVELSFRLKFSGCSISTVFGKFTSD